MATLLADKLHPNLLLLLKRICVIERTTMDELTRQVDLRRGKKMSLDTALGIFCASYFAQASTLQGHASARHGEGNSSIRAAANCTKANKKRYDLCLAVYNDSKISEDLVRYKTKPTKFSAREI